MKLKSVVRFVKDMVGTIRVQKNREMLTQTCVLNGKHIVMSMLSMPTFFFPRNGETAIVHINGAKYVLLMVRGSWKTDLGDMLNIVLTHKLYLPEDGGFALPVGTGKEIIYNE